MLSPSEWTMVRAFQGSGSASFRQLTERSGLNRTEALAAVLRLEAQDWVVCSERHIEDNTLVFLLKRIAEAEGEPEGNGKNAAG
jgi:DNA-binding MarR family transcriptional regulator